jgi:hypothetical protein
MEEERSAWRVLGVRSVMDEISVNVDPAFGCLRRVEVGCVADVSEEQL